MKNKLITACLIGMMAIGVRACGDKTAADGGQGTQAATEAGTTAQTENAGQTESASQTETDAATYLL